MAMSDHTPNAVDIFSEALALPAAERRAFLERACGGNQTLRAQVEELLRAHDEAGDFLKQAAAESPGLGNLGKVGEKAGDRVGRYKLLQQIGEGGWGVVFMAEQEQPVRRMVALKVVKPGMDTKNVIARFEAERQALALMEHPNIAKVLDAGATETGRPYFVMELVRGIKITDYCDQHSLSTTDRLGLFVQVCHAVQHAHQKGIIHRDLKPSNILVTADEAGAPLPKVIDFGIAKATSGQRLTDKTVFTAFEMLLGTPADMSPEQAAMTNVDVDTRSDIYSLGVLLYELLTSTTPFDPSELLKAGLDEVRRAITLQEPVCPSTRLSTMLDAELATVAQRRQAEAPKLIRAVRGDLDWIVIKALEKDRTRRYETANGLALDVKRYLANETIAARPPSKLYRIQKLVLRNKAFFVGLSAMAVLLVASLVIISASLAQERLARREAEAARQQAEADKRKAEVAAAKSRQVTRFLEDMLQGVGPSVALGRDATMLREILERTAACVGRELTNQPAVEAELRSIIGRLYVEIGNYDRAEEMHRAALAIYQKLSGSESAEAATALADIGVTLWRKGILSETEEVHKHALAIRRKLYGNDHPDVAASLNNIANVYRRYGRLAEAEALTRESLAIRRKVFGNENLEVADSLRHLSIILGDERKWIESEALAREVLAIRKRLLGEEHTLVATALVDLAWAIGGAGKLDEAEALERYALAMRRKLLGEENPEVAKSLYLVGDRVRQEGKLSESYDILSATLSIQRKLLGKDNPDTLNSMRSLALTLEAEGKLAEAELMRREALALWRQRGEGGTPQALAEVESLARILMGQKKYREAEQSLDDALTAELLRQPASAKLLAIRVDLKARRSAWGPAAADAALVNGLAPLNHENYLVLAVLQIKANDLRGYEELCRRFLTTFRATTNIYVADQLAKTCLLLPASDLDLREIGELVDLTVTRGSEDVFALPYFHICKALVEYRQGHFAAAIEWAQKPLDSPTQNAYGQACAIQAMAYWQLGKPDAAQAMLAKGNSYVPQLLPPQVAEERGNLWLAWLLGRISLDEAAALAKPIASPGKSPEQP